MKENVNDDTWTAVQIEYAVTNDYMSILKSVSLHSANARFAFPLYDFCYTYL